MTSASAASPTKASASWCGVGGCSLAYEACVSARASSPASRNRYPSRDSSPARSSDVGCSAIGRYPRYLRKASVAFVPPNPKAFESAISMSCLRAWFGT